MQIIRGGNTKFWEKNSLILMSAFNCNCNFHCSYCCNKDIRKNYSQTLKKDILFKLIEEIKVLNKEHYLFTLAGGEPTLYPDLTDFYKKLEDTLAPASTEVVLSTNGSRLSTLYPAIESSPHIKKGFIISLHTEQMPLAEYLDRLRDFAYPRMAMVKMLLSPGHLDDVHIVKETAKDLKYKFIVYSITIDGKLHPHYSKEEIDFLHLNRPRLHDPFFNDYKEGDSVYTKTFDRDDFVLDHQLVNYSGLYCAAGCNLLKIMPDAKVTRCHMDKTKIDFSLDNNSILDYPFLHQAQRCDVKRCTCYMMINLPKWRYPKDAPQYFKDLK